MACMGAQMPMYIVDVGYDAQYNGFGYDAQRPAKLQTLL